MLASQKKTKAIKDFRGLTNATEKVAKSVLEKFNYNVEQAADNFFASNTDPGVDKSGAATKGSAAQNVEKLFNQYAGKGSDADTIAEEKLEQFFSDVGIKQDEGPMAFVLSHKLKCKNVGEISRQEFTTAFLEANCDTIPKIAAYVKATKASVVDKGQSDQFRTFYRWVFDFNKETGDRKTIDKEAAVELWKQVLDPTKAPHVHKFVAFVEKDASVKMVTKDLWDQFYEFGVDIKPDLSNWADDGAWPVTIDDFVQALTQEKEKDEKKR